MVIRPYYICERCIEELEHLYAFYVFKDNPIRQHQILKFINELKIIREENKPHENT